MHSIFFLKKGVRLNNWHIKAVYRHTKDTQKKTRVHSVWDTFGTSLRLIFSFMHTPNVSAERLHPLKGFATVITDEALALAVDGLVPVQRAGGDERFPADVTPVRPLARVRPDVSRQVGAVAEALLAHGAAVRPLSALLAVAVVAAVGVEG